MKSTARLQLSIMMFLQFFIWGVWYVPMWRFLTANVSGLDWQWGVLTPVGLSYAATGIAAMVSPFFVGMIADRFFPSQKVFGVMHLLGAVFLLLASSAEGWGVFFTFLLLHLLCYMPTLALANSVLFQSLADPEQQAPPIRTLGTIGWIVSGVLVGGGFLGASGAFGWQVPAFLGGPADIPEGSTALGATAWPYYFGVGASVLLGLHAFTLPHTPPRMKGEKASVGDILGLRALGLMRDRSFAVFIGCSLLICIPLAFYYQSANVFLGQQEVPNAEGVMALGQVSEIFFLFLVPFFFRRLGVKKMLAIGMLFWVMRYVLFAKATPESHSLIYLGVLFHGICYDFFFFTGQLYTDRKAPRDVRSAAQGFIAFVTLGVGMFVGGILNGWWTGRVTRGEPGEEAIDWAALWNFPAIMAGVVLVLFILLFKDGEKSAPEEAS